MFPSIIRTALATGVAGSLISAPAALARGPVFGGVSSERQAIVLRTDAKAKRLKSAVIAWSADCKDGGWWAEASDVTATTGDPGFVPDPGELLVSGNGRGRFSGTQLMTRYTGDLSVGIFVEVSGRITRKRASGTMHAHVTMLDASGETQDGCDSGTVRWTATRAPGRIFGGKTSQEQPVVVRLDRSGRKVSNLMIGWGSEQCVPEGYLSFGESFVNFPLRSRRFGEAFTETYDLEDGSKRNFAYDVAGTVSRSAASGSLRVKVAQTDPAGAQTLSCDTGAVSWRALTG